MQLSTQELSGRFMLEGHTFLEAAKLAQLY